MSGKLLRYASSWVKICKGRQGGDGRLIYQFHRASPLSPIRAGYHVQMDFRMRWIIASCYPVKLSVQCPLVVASVTVYSKAVRWRPGRSCLVGSSDIGRRSRTAFVDSPACAHSNP